MLGPFVKPLLREYDEAEAMELFRIDGFIEGYVEVCHTYGMSAADIARGLANSLGLTKEVAETRMKEELGQMNANASQGHLDTSIRHDRERVRLTNLRNLMANLECTAERAMDLLCIPQEDRSSLLEQLS